MDLKTWTLLMTSQCLVLEKMLRYQSNSKAIGGESNIAQPSLVLTADRESKLAQIRLGVMASIYNPRIQGAETKQ